MSGKTFFVDLTKCTACRGCQVACKQWKKLPAEKTVCWGSHQNPKDLSGITYKLVRFTEEVVDGKVKWYFFPDQCRHCTEAPCQGTAEVEGSIISDPATGAILYTDLTKKEDYKAIRESCPYDIPRQAEDGSLVKCDMCIDRVRAGMLPSCVKTCPTGTMNFGDRDDMVKLAEETLDKVKGKFPKAELVDIEDVRVIYLTPSEPSAIYDKLMAGFAPTRNNGMTRKQLFAKVTKPVRNLV